MSGVISGGWEFVIAAYGWSAIVLGTYAFSVFSRHAKEKAAAARRASGSEVN